VLHAPALPLTSPPSLHPFRADPKHQSVHRLRWYYAAVRLPASVHHRHASLDFSTRPNRAGWDERRISRFSRKLLPCMPGVLDRAGYHWASPKRPTGCCLPPASTESASRVRLLSRLNALPTLSPVNASPSPLRAPPHDSGSLWSASPLTNFARKVPHAGHFLYRMNFRPKSQFTSLKTLAQRIPIE
jgi:hypothetical protein